MIEASWQQKWRIKRLLRSMLSFLDRVWAFDTHVARGRYEPHPDHGSIGTPPLDQYHAETVERLRRKYSEEELSLRLAELLFFPTVTGLDPVSGKYAGFDPETRIRARIVRAVAEVWTIEHRTEYAIDLLDQRLRYLLQHPWDDAEKPGPWQGWPPNLYFYPDLDPCLRLLEVFAGSHVLELPVETDQPATGPAFTPHPPPFHDKILPIVEDLILGRMNTDPLPTRQPDRKPERAYETYYQQLRPPADRLLHVLHAAGKFTYEMLREASGPLPYLIRYESLDPEPDERWCWPEGFRPPENSLRFRWPEFKKALTDYCRRIAWEFAQEVTEENAEEVRCFEGYAGVRFLLCACRNFERLRRKKIASGYEGLEAALAEMAHLKRLDPEDDEDRCVEELKQFKAKTLLAVLPHAWAAEDLVLKALGWEHVRPLLETVRRIGGFSHHDSWHERGTKDIGNDPDPSNSVLPLQELTAHAEQAGPEAAKKLLEALRKAQIGLTNTLTVVEAALDLNRPKILKAIEKRNQTAVKAFGLLPLDKGEDEVLERYLFLKRFAKESKKFGPQRQANEGAASQAGLANLAQRAGYADVARLEWAMEARVSDQATAPDTACQVGEYSLELLSADGKPEIRIEKSGKTLKSVPTAVRKSDKYQGLKELATSLKEQHLRFRRALEDIMTRAEPLSPEDLSLMSRMPVVRAMLDKIVFHAGGARSGLYEPDAGTLRGLSGEALAVSGEIRIAHPLHLYDSEALSDWQREVFQRRIVQPFKQVFRELYILTPAEEDTAIFSNRFAGHSIDPRVATKLLQSRGWQVESGDVTEVYKLFPKAGLQAIMDFPDAGHYLSELDPVTTDRVFFQPYPSSGYRFQEDTRLNLREVPPTLFSEVMRDFDLVVSVAQLGDGELISTESYLRRNELLLALIRDLGLANVEIDGHFARIKGHLASYRVHLASAAIHIEPGNYLCVVPDRWGRKTENLYLPFAGEEDPKFSEVVSKILLLSNDDKIKDESILAQIKR